MVRGVVEAARLGEGGREDGVLTLKLGYTFLLGAHVVAVECMKQRKASELATSRE